jgi:hypothetical protein
MIKIKANESKKLRFYLDIEGSNSVPEINYTIKAKPFDLVVECQQTNGVVEVDIPPLKDLVSSGEHEAKIGVILEGLYYEPWKGSILVEKPIAVKIKESIEDVDDAVQNTEKIKVKAKIEEIQEDAPESVVEPVKKVESGCFG